MFVLPVFVAFALSLTNWNGLNFTPEKFHFVGLDNYIRMLSDKDLKNALSVTIKITLIVTSIANIGGLCIALMLSKTGKLTSFVRAVFFIPYVMSTVAISFIWLAIMSYNGLFNNILEMIGMKKISLFATGKSALLCICIVEIWRVLGFYMVLYIAALQGVPVELEESCLLDGGNRWDTFWKVKLPLIAPQIVTGIMMSVTTEMRLYDLVHILTGGGPGSSTKTMAYSIITQGFTNWRMGYAGAIAVILSIVIITLSIILRKVQSNVEVEM